MFAAIRRLSKSVIGTIVMVLFLLAILASFALADISGISSGPTGTGRGTLAEVGSEEVTEREFDSLMRQALKQAQQENPEATYATIAREFDNMLQSLIDEEALLVFAADHGFILSKRLVDAEIANLPQTRGLDGKFSEQAYQAFLQQQQLTDEDVRRLLGVAITQRLVLAPVAVDARLPLGIARPYASMLLEQREGEVALIPTDAFRAGLNPSDGDLQSFYAQNRQRYMVPEQRVLRFARIGPETVVSIAPTDAEVAAHYRANQATYAGSETRVISQVVVQDRRQADPIAARAKSGASFAAAAAPAGFAAADVNLGPQTRAQFTGAANEAIANAVFSATKGAVIGPIRSDLGWHVVKIEDIRGASGRTLEQARGEIAALLTANKRKDALTNLVTRFDEQIAGGASFAEAVGAAKLPVTTTPAITANGRSRSDPAYSVPAELEPVIKAGFAMAPDDDPEIVTLPGEAGYALVAVDRVQEAAPAPLAEIKDQVRNDWIRRKANDRARAVAADIAAKVGRGVAMTQAVREAGVTLPPVEPVNARRLQIAQAPPQAAAPLRLLFSLTQGKSRMGGDPQGRGFFIVKTNKITAHDAMTNPILIARTQSEFQRALGEELGQQMLNAMKSDQGVERNEKSIAATRRRYSGAN